MNKAKLIVLCAKAMGFEDCSSVCWGYKGKYFHKDTYNPLDDANQADDLLEYVADGRDWLVWHSKLGYGADIALAANAYQCETPNLAKILCSLRASPEVTNAEINDAMEGE